MFKNILTFLFLLTACAMIAQAPARLPMSGKMEPALRNKINLTGFETWSPHLNPNLPLLSRTDRAEIIGTTEYDLQSNSGTQRRLVNLPDGTKYATWTRGFTGAPSYPDRGTGYNKYTPGTGWGEIPTATLEGSVRTGWPSVDALADGTPVVISHRGDLNSLYMGKYVNDAWQFANVPNNTTTGVLWSRMAIGGPDGNTIHLVGITYPGTTNDAQHLGSIGHVLYYRSLNGGDNWDQIDIVLPEIDSNYYKRMDADAYAIDADGDYVVVAYFGDFGDIKVVKSEDNGDTWTTWTIKDSPLDKYVVDQGYTFDQLPVDPNSPDSMAIQSSDNAGAVLIDENGMAHAWYGEMYIQDDVLNDATTSYYPTTMGIRYWNETYGEDSTTVAIGGIIDANGNDTLDIAANDEIALYFSSLTSHPSVGIDADGNIYMAYASFEEGLIKEDATPSAQHFRHIYLTLSKDKGVTWEDPIDLINTEWASDSDLFTLMETMFPSMARRVDSQVHLTYQQDFEPGLSVRGDEDAADDNYITYIGVDRADLGTVSGTVAVVRAQFSFQLSPNPASALVKLTYELPVAGTTSLRIYDMQGSLVKQVQNGVQAAGKHDATLNTASLSSGIYMVCLQTGGQLATQKLVVR